MMQEITSYPILIDGKEIGRTELHGHEIHMQIDKKQALLHARRIIRQYFAPKIAELGYLTTMSDDCKTTKRFLERLGFYRIGGMGTITMYRIDAVRIQ